MLIRIFLPIGILALAIAGFIALKNSRPESPVVEKPEKVWYVDSVTVTKAEYSPEFLVYGRVETPRQTTLKAALSADVVKVNALSGERVERDQLLLELDAVDATLIVQQRQADLNEVKALIEIENDTFNRDKILINNEKELLKLTENSVSRAKQLEQTRLASAATLDDALAAKQRQLVTLENREASLAQHDARLTQLKARKNRAEALLAQAQRDVERTQIKSPYDGRVAMLNVSVADRVRAGDPLVTVYDVAQLEVRAQLPEHIISSVKGQIEKGAVLAQAVIDGEPVSLVLSRLSAQVDAKSGGVDAYFSMQNTTSGFALGRFVALTVILPPKPQLVALPYNALYGLDHVYCIKQGRLSQVEVKQVGEITLESGERQVLVTSNDLVDGDKVITTQLPNAIVGLKVEALHD